MRTKAEARRPTLGFTWLSNQRLRAPRGDTQNIAYEETELKIAPTHDELRTNSRRIKTIAAVAVGALLMTACSGPLNPATSETNGETLTDSAGAPSEEFPAIRWDPNQPAGEKPTTPRTIGFINDLGAIGISGPFQEALHAAAEKGEMDVITTSPNGDSSQGIQQLEQLLQRGVTGIYSTLVAPEMTPPNVAAMKQGAMVVQWNQGPATSMLSSLQYDGGYRAGQYVADYVNDNMNGSAQIAWISQDFNLSLLPRTQGFKDALAEAGISDMLIAEVSPPKSPGATQSAGNALANTLLQQHPELDVIACASDDLALGAATAFKTAGRSPAETMTTGVDGTDQGLQAIRAGDSSFKATVAVNFTLVAYLSGRLFGRWADGLSVPKFQLFNYALVDSPAAAEKLSEDLTLEALPEIYDRLLEGDNTYVTPLGSISYSSRMSYYNGTVPVILPQLNFDPSE